MSTCASVLRDTPAARWKWRRTSTSRANWTLRTWWKTAARVWGPRSSPGIRSLTVSSNPFWPPPVTHLYRHTGHFPAVSPPRRTSLKAFLLSAGSHQLFNDTYSHICLTRCHFCCSTLSVTDQVPPLSTERAILGVSELCAAEFTRAPTEQDGTNAVSRRGKKMVTFFMLEHIPVCRAGTKSHLWWAGLSTLLEHRGVYHWAASEERI